MNNKKNIKIKHSKGRLYKKRKSPARKVLETVILVALVGGLIFVGYSAAGPLIEHLTKEDEGTTPAPWTPDESISGSGSESDTQEPDNTSSEGASSATENHNGSGLGSYYLSKSALKSSSALTSALTAAKNAGFTTVLIPMKDNSGKLLYKSSISYIKDTELIEGTLTAKKIASAATEMGLTPKALIPTLLDSSTSIYVEDMGYTAVDGWSWLDNTAENGGKRWVDPFLDGTKKYYTDLTKELKTAGFDEVIISELRFPAFNPIDQSYLLARNFETNRYKALTTLYNTAYTAADKKSAVAINIKDVLDGYGKSFGATAEILSDKSFTGTVYLIVDLTQFGTELKTGETTSIKLSTDPVKKSASLISKAVGYIGTNITVEPVILPNGISTETLVECYKNLAA